jgi:hypothetical protein
MQDTLYNIRQPQAQNWNKPNQNVNGKSDTSDASKLLTLFSPTLTFFVRHFKGNFSRDIEFHRADSGLDCTLESIVLFPETGCLGFEESHVISVPLRINGHAGASRLGVGGAGSRAKITVQLSAPRSLRILSSRSAAIPPHRRTLYSTLMAAYVSACRSSEDSSQSIGPRRDF